MEPRASGRRATIVVLVCGLLLAGLMVGIVNRPSPDCRSVRAGSRDQPIGWASVAGLVVGFGYDSIVERAGELSAMVASTDRVGPAAVSVVAGRADWTAYPWPDHRESWSQPVRDTGCDYVGRALDALGTRPDGTRRGRILVVDALVTGWIDRDPSIAGIDARGRRSESFASLAQLGSGEVGDRIVELVSDVARRYRPDAVSVTELFADRYTFGADDLLSFMAFTGEDDWPRTPRGEIDEQAPSVWEWRSHVLAGLVRRCREATADSPVALLMEVRVNWNDPLAGRPDSGQDYELLLDAADELVSWDYFALQRLPPSAVGDAVRVRVRRWPERWVSSVGLWGPGQSTAAPDDVAEAVESAFDAGSPIVWVTPESRFTDEHWTALE